MFINKCYNATNNHNNKTNNKNLASSIVCGINFSSQHDKRTGGVVT